MKNIVLIGMPGCGKSTIGVVLAKVLGFDFVDADVLIQKKHGKLLREADRSGRRGNDEDVSGTGSRGGIQGGRKKACKIRGDIKPCKMRRIRFGCELGTSGVRDGTERDRF